ncbi:MAG: hypothetical protein ACM3SQ_00855 [Betaproteobacteria bacterium]
MQLIAGAVIVAAAIGGAGWLLAARISARHRDAAVHAMLRLFAPAIAETAHDPRALLIWYPLATLCRSLDPDSFARLDRAGAAPFPFTRDALERAHARWTADWLAWERTHDEEYRLKAAAAEEALAASGGSPVLRGRLEAVEREKLETYQRRYQEYVQVARALQQLGAGG